MILVDRIAWRFYVFSIIVKALRHSGVFFFVLFLCGRLDAAESDGNLLIVSGACTYTNLSKTGKVFSGFRGHFRLSTDFVRWNLYYSDPDRPTRQQTTFDGTHTYSIFEDVPLATNKLNVSDLLTNGGYALDGNYYSGIDTAVVLPRQQPTALFAPAQLPWLAGVCCDLFRSPLGEILPPYVSLGSPARPAFRAQLEKGVEGSCGCGKILQFVLVAKEWRTLSSRWGASLGSSYQPKDDFVEGELKVLSSTNVLGRCIPLQAQMHRVRPASSGDSNLLRSTLTMHATSLVVRVGVIERPNITRTTHISDGRFEAELPGGLVVNYAVTNQAWVSASNAEIQQLVKAQKETRLHILSEQRRMKRMKSMKIIIPVVLLLSVPLLFAIMSRFNRENKNINSL